MASNPGLIGYSDARLEEIIYLLLPASQQGSVTISNPDTTAAVTLAQVQPNATYTVLAQVTAVTGSPALDSKIVWTTAPATTGFTINLGAATGAGATVTIRWVLFPSAV